MIDAKHVHKLLECKYDFKHWIKDVISSFNFKDGIDYISYRYDNICFVYGRRKSGSFNIRDFNGENSKDVSRKKFKLIRGKRHPIILK